MTLLRAKVAVLGDSKTGKTALTQVFATGSYPRNYVLTNGVDYVVKNVNIPDTEMMVELHMYDCAGDPLFETRVAASLLNTNMIVLVYDVTTRASFERLAHWHQFVTQAVLGTGSSGRRLPGVVIANKTDLNARATVTASDGASFAQQHGLEFFETSAAELRDVDAPFYFLANNHYQAFEEKARRLADIASGAVVV